MLVSGAVRIHQKNLTTKLRHARWRVNPRSDHAGGLRILASREAGGHDLVRIRKSGWLSVSQNERVAWVDYGKGICIILVVMMHSTLGVQAEIGIKGFMDHVVEFARPFRMPDFFLLSGLFVPVVIGRTWRDYLDRKVAHFAYFYTLWLTIQFAFKTPHMAAQHGGLHQVFIEYLWSFVQPFGTLWFIYQLPIFFVVTKAVQRIPRPIVWCIAAALQMARIHTGWSVIDDFCMQFVFFYSGYALSSYVFRFAKWVASQPTAAVGGLVVWAVIEQTAVSWILADVGGFQLRVADLPVISLVLGGAGALAVVSVSSLMQRVGFFDWVRYCGRNSLPIYLAFFLPMAISRRFFISTGVVPEIGTVSLLVTICGVAGALVIFWIAQRLRIRFLFERPSVFRMMRNETASKNATASSAAPTATQEVT